MGRPLAATSVVLFFTGLLLQPVDPGLYAEVSGEDLHGQKDPKQSGPVLHELKNGNRDLERLRSEISDNLRSVARTGRPAHPVRVYRYRVQEEDNFYRIMAKVSQDEDTLASVNELLNPAELAPGMLLKIPNIRGILVTKRSSLDPEKMQQRYGKSVKPIALNEGWFLPGVKFPAEERDFFRGVGFAFPLKEGIISSRFGRRSDPFTDRQSFHGGIDIAAPTGSDVFAGREGKVVFAGRRGGYGRLVIIQHRYGYQTYYGHLSKILVQRGDTVRRKEAIGLVGSTGRSTGPHLHFEVRKEGVRKRPRLIH